MWDHTNHAPYFDGRLVFMHSANRAYRIFLLPDQIAFIHASSDDLPIPRVATYFGFLGLLLGVARDSHRAYLQKRFERLENIPLAELLAKDRRRSFSISFDKIVEARVEPRSLFHGINWFNLQHVGLFSLKHRAWSYFPQKLVVEINEQDGMDMLTKALPVLLGDNAVINVAWDEERMKYLRK